MNFDVTDCTLNHSVSAEQITREILVQRLEVDPRHISDSALLEDELGLDSLALLDFSLVASDVYGIGIEEHEIRSASTYAELLACVCHALQHARGA
jgi:acyl carrier protein